MSTLTSVLVLPAGCALHLPLDHVEVLLEAEPTSMRQVSLRDHILLLVHEALLGSGVEVPWVQGLERATLLGAPGEYMALEPRFLCAAVPEMACQEEAKEEDADADADTEFLPPGMDAEAGCDAGLCSPAEGCQTPVCRALSQSPGLGCPTPVQRDALLTTTTTWTCTFRSPSPTHHSNLYLPPFVRVPTSAPNALTVHVARSGDA